MPARLPPEASWERRGAGVPAEVVRQLAGSNVEPLPGGLVNGNYRVGDRVLRITTRGSKAASVELAVLARVADLMPVPRVLEAGELDGWPTCWLEAMPGRRLADILAAGADGRPYARALGKYARALHQVTMPEPGFLDASLAVAEPLGAGFYGTALQAWCDGVAGRRLGPERCARILAVPPPELSPAVLLHGDFKPTNVLVAGDVVTAVLDWEFAWAGPALADLGQLLRWEDHVTPGFAEAVAEGYGPLPTDWRDQAARLDLLNLVGFLDDAQERPKLFADVLARIDRSLGRTA